MRDRQGVGHHHGSCCIYSARQAHTEQKGFEWYLAICTRSLPAYCLLPWSTFKQRPFAGKETPANPTAKHNENKGHACGEELHYWYRNRVCNLRKDSPKMNSTLGSQRAADMATLNTKTTMNACCVLLGIACMYACTYENARVSFLLGGDQLNHLDRVQHPV
eukprot:scaffold319941_cov18-Tisochrysis_lutea.AAC.2